MISLQDSDDVPANLFLSPLVVLLFLPLLVTKIDFVFCQNYHYYYYFFSKTQLVMQQYRRKKTGCSTGFECLISRWHTWSSERMYGRSVGRPDGSDVITKPKFLALMGLPKSLSYEAPLARALRRARELRY